VTAADSGRAKALRRIGVVIVAFSPRDEQPQGFRQALREAGYSEGRDVVIDWRSAQGDYSRVPSLVADLIRDKPDLIVVESTVGILAVKRATSTIPIVMAIVADPIGSGIVTSLAHPGGNITGLSLMGTDLSAKRLQLLKDLVPRLARLSVLWNPATPFHAKATQDLKAAAELLSIEPTFVPAPRPTDFSSALASERRRHTQALYVVEDPLFFFHRSALLDSARRASLPAIYAQRSFTDAGGLISYGANLGEMFRRSAGYVDRILKGAKPGDLPIEQAIKFELVINLKTASSLGLTVPQSMLVAADNVVR
jgi:putative ABC transport system substrate-binding protein